MRGICLCSLALIVLAFSGCTEMRVEGDAKVFQSSAVGSIIRTVIGLGLIGLGITGIVGSVVPDRKPKNRSAKPNEKLSSGQRVGLAMFGGSMVLMGLVLAFISLLFPSKLHVTVYPDRVAMASTYSQTGGKEVVVPFAGLSTVELRDEPNAVGKFKTFLVFTLTNGGVIKQDAGNNERQAVDTIRQALAEYQQSAPAVVENRGDPVAPSPNRTAARNQGRMNSRSAPEPDVTEPKAEPLEKEFPLKRYVITSPIPEEYRLVGPDDAFEVGDKLKANYAGSWHFVTVVAVNSDGTITCNWDSWKSYTYKMKREDLVTANGKEATAPGESPTSPPPTSPPSSQYTLKRYEITIPIPSGYSVVGADVDVKVGTKLQACYAGQWESVTVVAVNDDGTITCNWDKWKAFTYKMVREDLIIAGDNEP